MRGAAVCLLLWGGLFLWQAPSDLSGSTHSDSPSPELAASVSALLPPAGVRATVGATTLTFWWVKQLPLKPATDGSTAASGAAWSSVQEGTLVGAVKVDKNFRDVRGRVIKAGTYTLRYGLQPTNGDHLGVSPYREFLLLSPAAADTDPAPKGHDESVDLSKQTIGGSHPAVWSIDPPVTADSALSVHTTDLGHKALVMEVPVAGGVLRFGVVLVGKIEA